MHLNFIRRSALIAMTVISFAAISTNALAQSEWKAIVLSATPGGWFETRGTATADASLSTIVIKDASGIKVQTYKGKLNGNTWTGTRTVHESENRGEPMKGTLTKMDMGGPQLNSLILTNEFTSANFLRTGK